MKISNTVCSGCNQLLDLIYHHRGEFGETSEAFCYHCKKDYPLKPCRMCQKATIHIGFNYGACTECIINHGFNIQKEYYKVLNILNKVLLWINTEQDVVCDNHEEYLEGRLYLTTIERLGYAEKCHVNDSNQHIQNSDKGIPTEQP